MKKKIRRRKLLKQRLIGLGILAIAVFAGGFCAAAGEDATAYMVLAPLAIWLIATRKVVVL